MSFNHKINIPEEARALKIQLLQATQSVGQVQEFVRKLAIVTDADAAALRFFTYRNFTFPITITSDNKILDDSFFVEYDTKVVRDDPQLKLGFESRLRRHSLYQCHEHFSSADRKRLPYFHKFLAKHSVEWVSGFFSPCTDDYAAGFTMVRGPNKPHFDDTQKALLSEVIPVFTTWARNFIDVQKLLLAKRAAYLTFQSGRPTSACVDAFDNTVWRTERVRPALLSVPGFYLSQNRIAGKKNTVAENFLQKIAAFSNRSIALNAQEAVDREEKLSFRTNKGSFIDITLKTIVAEEDYPKNSLSGCLAIGEQGKSIPSIDALAALSKKEFAVAELVAEGKTVNVIAQELKVAHSTIQTHLRRTYKKLGIHRKEALASLFVEAKVRREINASAPVPDNNQ